MKRLLVTLLTGILLIGTVLLAGCGSESNKTEGETQAPKQQANNETTPKVLSVGTHGVGSLFNTMGTGISTVLSKAMSLEIRTVPLTGPQEWMPLIKNGEMELGVLSNWDAGKAWRGEATYGPISDNQGFPISLITSGHKNLTSIVVAESSGIKTASDLKGKKFAGNVTGSPGITAQADAFLANLGLTKEDVQIVPVPDIGAGIQAIIEGKADAATGTIGMGKVQELDASKGARWLSLDSSPDAVEKMNEYFPGKLVNLSPSKERIGIREDSNILAYDSYFVGRNDLSEAIVYDIVKGLWENNNDLVSINAILSDWTTENFVIDNFTIPYHPGAIKFYKEKGVWTPEMEQQQQKLLAEKK